MPANVQNASFLPPGVAMIAPDIAAQEQALARRQAFVDALRQQGQEEINPNGGAISWTQGLAKMLAAYAGGRGQHSVDKERMELASRLRGAMAPLFGQSAGGQGQDGQPPAYTNPTARALVGQPPAAPGGGQPLNLPATGQTIQIPATPSDSPPAIPPTAGGDNPTPQAPQAPPQAPPQQGSLQMPGLSPEESQARYMLDPQGYMQQLQASSSPTDVMKNLAAQYGWGTPAFKQAMAEANFKNNYVAPVNGRPGSTLRDAHDPTRIIGYDPTSPGNGAVPTFDASGNVTGWTLPNGATQVAAAMEGARTAAAAANKPIAGYDAQGNPVFSNDLNAAHGGTGSPGGFRPGPGLGAAKFADTMGAASGQFFSGLADSAADAKNRVFALNQMLPLVNGPTQFGPGTPGAEKMAGFINGVGKAFGQNWSVNNQTVTDVNEFNKFAAQYSARAAQELGLGGSDKRIEMTVAATPNAHMTNDALRHVIPVMIGLENAKQGMANAGQSFAQAHPGPNAQGQFLQQWRTAYDPRIFTAMAQGPSGVQALLKTLPAPERQALIHKSQMLAEMGAFQQ